MTRYLVLIRGINVGGIVLKMDDLKALMAEFGFEKIRTYIQSGNAIFESDSDDVRELALRIKDIIRSRMGLEIEAFVKTKADLERMLDSLPFGDDGGKKLYITVLGDRPEADRVDELRSLNTDAEKIAVVGDTAYIYCADGYGETRFSNNYLQKKLGVPCTTRNLNTMRKLLAMMAD
ncbi:MAG: hypothetical protein A2Y36_03795 [Treponema sp. GWA1_62_8]|nr:MAG: hypothetical protein A2Y36_03795 [Treponema sp. GWA1_62_8]OHE70299.1 MAG: hypothetical protein A2001_10035 [Treponema sp. GWC1_61_84]